jgi:hypothetical protein
MIESWTLGLTIVQVAQSHTTPKTPTPISTWSSPIKLLSTYIQNQNMNEENKQKQTHNITHHLLFISCTLVSHKHNLLFIESLFKTQ